MNDAMSQWNISRRVGELEFMYNGLKLIHMADVSLIFGLRYLSISVMREVKRDSDGSSLFAKISRCLLWLGLSRDLS